MINLLPMESKQEIKAARFNVLLLRYLLFLFVSFLFMVVIIGTGYYLIHLQQQATEKKSSSLNETSAEYKDTKQKAENFANNLNIASSILKNEVIYSDLVVNITKTLPAGTVLTDFNITTQNFGKPLVISARTKSQEGGLLLKEHLEKSVYFENVSISTITNPEENADSSISSDLAKKYPYTVILSGTFIGQPRDNKEASL